MVEKLKTVLAVFTADRTELAGAEIARVLGRPRSTVYRMLGAFTEAGFLNQDPASGRYRLGILLALLGDLARRSTSLQRITLPVLRGLGEGTGELATLMIRSGTEAVTLEVVEAFHPIMLPGLLGEHHPLHATAGGKALLAWETDSVVEECLAGGLQRFTPTTITDAATFRRELELVRAADVAVSRGEWFDDIMAFGAPVRNHRGDVVAALSVGCPRSRWTRAAQRRMQEALLDAASQVSVALGCRVGPPAPRQADFAGPR